MGFKVPSIEDLIRSANDDLIEVQNEISYIKSTDSDKIFLNVKYKDAINFIGNPSQSDFDLMKDILLNEKLRKEYELKGVLSKVTVKLRDQKINDILDESSLYKKV